ncbi:hypothetical protein, partial [Arthrobacter sp. H41]|uniref:hypothetical protein n=1 Tax=Arthrobacter sp. H41 TaxID=1312978 RepID=UPI00138AF5D8
DQRADIVARSIPPGWSPPVLAQLPCLIGVELDLSEQMELRFQGEPSELSGLARSLLLQISFGHAGAVHVICWGSLPDLPLAARFLPGVELVTHPGKLGLLLRDGSRQLVFAFGGRPLPDSIARPAPVLAQLPCLIGVELDLSEQMELRFQGEPSELSGLARSLLLQISFGHAGAVHVICWGSLPDLPLAARFLPGVELVTHPGKLGLLLRDGSRQL